MPKFRLREDHLAINLYAPEGADSIPVEPGQTVEVPGKLADKSPVDAYIVVNGGEERAWPKATWELADKPAAPAAPVKEK